MADTVAQSRRDQGDAVRLRVRCLYGNTYRDERGGSGRP